jgi:predicted RNA binding protein YcfA (HicA-like mRNA interferase family)
LSPFLPQLKAKDVIRVIRKLGFEFDRQSGSHAVYYRKSDNKRTVVSVHPGKDIKPKTLSGIVRDIGLDPVEFKKLL